jgi:hypothetical protein
MTFDSRIGQVVRDFLSSFTTSPQEHRMIWDPALENAVMQEVASWMVDGSIGRDILNEINKNAAAMGQVRTSEHCNK